MSAPLPIIEVLFTPADFARLPARDLSDSVCIVFDVLRATSTMVTALANGAREIVPVATICEALALRCARPDLLLAGERGGRRILARHTGTVDFDLGNSPREFTAERVSGRSIAMTTTNGTRALRAASGARACFAGSFLNLEATLTAVRAEASSHVAVVCSGTGEGPAIEDTLAAGALVERWTSSDRAVELDDSAVMTQALFRGAMADLPAAVARSHNARWLLATPELADDVAFCLQVDAVNISARMDSSSVIKAEA